MYYCGNRGIGCEYANSNGHCSVTACMKDNYKTITITSPIINFGRTCEICGETTEDINLHICAKCRLKLHDLLYKDDNWGKG